MIGLAGVGGSAILSACGSGDESGNGQSGGEAATSGEESASFSCNDLSGLNDQQMQQREQMTTSLNYVEESPNPEQVCSNCALYTQPAEGEQCGGCTLFPGPVHPNGYCTSWAPAA